MIRRILLVIVCICAVFALLTAYSGYVRPDMTLVGKLAPLAVMVWPWMALLLVVTTLAAAVVRSRGWIVGVVAMGLCWGPLMAISPVHVLHNEVPAGAHKLKLLTFNVMGFKGYKDEQARNDSSGNRVLSFIIERDADIVCLQEADAPLRPGRYGMSRAQCDTLRRLYPYIIYRSEGALELLSKYPATFFSLPRTSRYSRWPYMGAFLDIAGRKIAIINCHLESIGLTGDDKRAYEEITEGEGRRAELSQMRHSALGKLSAAFRQRAAQTDTIRAVTDTIRADAQIVCGDFNDVPLSHALLSLEEVGFEPVYPATGFGPAVTFHADKFYFRIDHILTRGNIIPVSSRIFKNGLSDHYAFETTLAITAGQ